MTCYYDDEEYYIVPEKEKVYIKHYEINTCLLKDAIQNLRKSKVIIKETSDFHPTTGVLGELKDYFVKNSIDY